MNSIIKVLFIFLLFIVLKNYAQSYVPGYKEAGLASYYSDKFIGKKTASGEVYSKTEFTAAHRKLPFNTLVRVTNTHNGKWIYVRINDRGPFSPKRIIDISYAAAKDIDMISSGITDVIIEVIRIGSPKINPKDSAYLPQWSVAKTPISKKKVEKKPVSKPKPAPKPKPKPVSKPKPAPKPKPKPVSKPKPAPKPKPKPVSKPKPKPISKPKPFIISKLYKPTATYSIWGVKRSPRGFAIQLGSFSNEKTVKNAGKSAIESGLELVYVYASKTNNKIIYRLLTGNYDSKEEAERDLYKIQSKGFVQAFIRKHLIKN